MEDFIRDCLQEHNRLRQLHGVPPLKHNEMLDESAKEWADQLVQKERLSNSPLSTRGAVGENISMRTSTAARVDLSGKEVAEQWYKDISKYNFDTHTGPAGNFTQLIWKSTEEIGFAKVSSPNRCIVVVHYRPPGNVHGMYEHNVLPPLTQRGSADGQEKKPSRLVKERETTLIETRYRDDGSSYQVRKEIREFADESGNITQKVEEFQMDDDECTPRKLDTNGVDVGFVEKMLERHNLYRSRHGAPPLKLSKKLSSQCQKWAEFLSQQTCLSNSNHQYKGSRVGENIASRWSNGVCDYTGYEVVDHWYAEEAKYDYSKETRSVQGIGNFTQMVWKGTQRIGVGKVRVVEENGCSRVLVVCQYHPPGNIFNHFMVNVCPPVSASNLQSDDTSRQ